MATGDTATIGGLTFTANSDISPAQVATAFANYINSGSTSSLGTFSNIFQGGYSVADNGSGALTFTATAAGPNSIAVSGNVSASNVSPLNYSNVAVLQTGGQASTEEDQITFGALSAGQSITVGGLTYTAGPGGETAQQVAAAFANLSEGKTAAQAASTTSSREPITIGGTYSGGPFTGYNTSSYDFASPSSIIVTSTIQGPGYQITPTGTGSTSVSVIRAGSNGSQALQTVALQGLNAGDTATVGGLTFTASSDISAANLATIFANKITSPANNPSASIGTFGSSTFIGGFTASSSSSNLTLTGQYSAPQAAISVNGSVTPKVALSAANVTTLASGSNTGSALSISSQSAAASAIATLNSSLQTVNNGEASLATSLAALQNQSTSNATAAGLNTDTLIVKGNLVNGLSTPTIQASVFSPIGDLSPSIEVTTKAINTAYLADYSIGSDGVITGKYSDGSTYKLAQLALATFQSNTGLKSSGNDSWMQTAASGVPVIGSAGLLGVGTITGSSLEASNTDQTGDMVKLLAAQQAYQSNAQTIKVEDQNFQTLIAMGG